MYYSNNMDSVLYSQLMSHIKKVNADWLSLRKSRQYKWGLFIDEVIDDVCHFNFLRLYKSFKKWNRGKKSTAIKSTVRQNIVKRKEPNYFSKERIAIYTAILGVYDKVLEPYCIPDNCDYYIFTDQQIPQNSIWRKMEWPSILNGMSNMEKNRYLKMHPHALFDDYKYSIYVDGNVQIVTDLTEYINCLGDNGIGIHAHNTRSCIYDELIAVVETNRMSRAEGERYRLYIQEKGMPQNYGLMQCSVIVREHGKTSCINIMEDWWNMYMKYGKRDQLYLPFVLFRYNISVEEITVLGNNLYNNPSFRVETHV